MKNIKFIISVAILSILFFNGCSSKYQTNKLPNEEKITIPTKVKKRVYYLNQDIKEDFKKYVITEFSDNPKEELSNKKIKTSTIPKGLWTEGYNIDKKRY